MAPARDAAEACANEPQEAALQSPSKESPSQDVLDSFLTGAGARTEHYEIAAYEGLVTAADAIGETEVVELLNQNLEQEKIALEKLKTIGKRLAQVGAKQQTRA